MCNVLCARMGMGLYVYTCRAVYRHNPIQPFPQWLRQLCLAIEGPLELPVLGSRPSWCPHSETYRDSKVKLACPQPSTLVYTYCRYLQISFKRHAIYIFVILYLYIYIYLYISLSLSVGPIVDFCGLMPYLLICCAKPKMLARLLEQMRATLGWGWRSCGAIHCGSCTGRYMGKRGEKKPQNGCPNMSKIFFTMRILYDCSCNGQPD